jgi:DNA-binding MarR family transcriptional regulator
VADEGDHDRAIATVDASLVALVRSTTRPRIAEMLNDWAGVKIERSGFSLLARIEELPGARLAELADAADIDVSTASRQIARLVELDLVERAPDPDEHRARRHRLTGEGERVLWRLRRSRHAWIASILASFSPAERDRFADLLHRFVDALDRADGA